MKYLSNPDFITKYFEIWNNCKREFFKLEVLPEYDEFSIADWATVDAKQTQQLINRVQGELFDWKDRYGKKIYTDKVEFLRIRYIPFPLTKYLLIELSSYKTSQAIGAKIDIIEDSDLPKIKPALKDCFGDFLLFDDTHLFKLDNPGGITNCGAFYTDNAAEIAPYIQMKNELKALSKPLDDYLKLLNIQFINNTPDES